MRCQNTSVEGYPDGCWNSPIYKIFYDQEKTIESCNECIDDSDFILSNGIPRRIVNLKNGEEEPDLMDRLVKAYEDKFSKN